MAKHNKEILTGFLQKVWTEGNIDAIDQYLAPTYTIYHDPGDPWDGQILDIAGFKQRVTQSRAPFPDQRFKAGVRRFPEIVQTSPDMEGVPEGRAAVEFLSKTWSGESFMAVGMQDPVLGPDVMNWLRTVIRGCPEPMIVADGGHFLQEWGEPIASNALQAFGVD